MKVAKTHLNERWRIAASALAVCFVIPAQLVIPVQLVAQDAITCPEPEGEGSAGLTGSVTDASTGTPLPGAMVMVSWVDDDGESGTAMAATDAVGMYVACGLPAEQELLVYANFNTLWSDPVTLSITTGPPADWNITLDLPGVTVREGLALPGRIVGRVADRTFDRAVDGAAIRIENGEVDERTVSDGSGRFLFGPLEPGTYRIHVEHIGFENLDRVIEVVDDRTLEINFSLTVDAVELEPLVVTALRQRRLELAGFYDRKDFGEKLGLGVYATQEDIKRSGAQRLTSFLRTIPAVRVQCSGSGIGRNACRILMTRGTGGFGDGPGGCQNTNVWIDGAWVIRPGQSSTQTPINDLVSVMEVAGIEIYRGPSELPAQYGGSSGRCGAIVIWTGVPDRDPDLE